MKPLDLTKPLQTRYGEKAELVYDGLSGDWPLAVVVHHEYSGKVLRTYTREGVLYQDEDGFSNLINVPEKQTIWVNIYEELQTCHPSRESADHFADHFASANRIACVRVEYEEGEGL